MLSNEPSNCILFKFTSKDKSGEIEPLRNTRESNIAKS